MTSVEAAPYPALPPIVELPPGAWDSHVHVFGPPERFAQLAGAAYSAPTQDVDRLLAVMDNAGVTRAVVVQPSVYGRDNSCLLDAVSRAPKRLVGVVDVEVDRFGPSQIADLHERGVRGIRLRTTQLATIESRQSLYAECASIGWHISLCLDDIGELVAWENTLATSSAAVVIEGMAQPHRADFELPGFRALLRLLDRGAVFVKLSHFYNVAPYTTGFDSCRPIVEALAANAPTKLVWGSDWPHPMVHGGVMPHYTQLIALMRSWLGGDLLKQILVSNPGRLFGLPTKAEPPNPSSITSTANPQGDS